MAKCVDCVHHPVCKVHGELLPKRNDVDRICDNYLNVAHLRFDDFWKMLHRKEN